MTPRAFDCDLHSNREKIVRVFKYLVLDYYYMTVYGINTECHKELYETK